MKPLPVTLRRVLIALAIFSVGPVLLPFLRAQTDSTAVATNPAAASPTMVASSAVTNSATPAATNSAASAASTNAPAASTNAPAASTNAAAASTNSAAATGTTTVTGTETDQSTPGAMAAPGTELIGPPQLNANVPPNEATPTNNPAVQDVTNNPYLVAGLGQRRSPFYFGLDLGEMYDDNILISPDNQKIGSFITHISPSIDFQEGDQTTPHSNYLNLYFSPTVYIYDNRSRYNRTDYNGDFYYQYNWTRLSLGLEQNYQHLTDSTLDQGTLVSRNIYTTKGTASYYYNDDLTLFATADQQISAYPGLTIKEWDLDTFALYQIAPKLSIGAGPRFALIDITRAANQQHQDFLFRLRYLPDPHFSVSFEGGAEFLQYQNNAPDRLLPIFDANVYYEPFEDTTLFLQASKQTYNSFDLNGDTIDFSTVEIGASQVFLKNFTATVTGGYHDAEYQNGISREDNYFYGKGSLQWTPNEWLQVEASYEYSNNNSTFSDFSFTDNQVDIQSTVKF